MDKMYLSEMEFYGYHGVLDEETKLGQRFVVDIELSLDLQHAGRTDDLHSTVNYAEVYEKTKEIVEGPPYQLIESVAEKIATEILATFSLVKQCKIKVMKPNPPIHGHYRHVAVEITRGRTS